MADTVVVVQKGDHSLGFYDFASGRELDRIALDSFPHEFAVTPDGRYACMCHFGLALAEDEGAGGHTVSVVDIPARQRVGTLDCGAYRRPHGIALDAAGRVYVLSEADGMLLIAAGPRASGFDRVLPTGGEGSHIVSVTGDGRLAFSSNMKSNTVTAIFTGGERGPVAFTTGARPEGSVLDAAGERLYVACRESAEVSVIDVRNLEPLAPIGTRPGPVRICWDASGRLLVPLYHDSSLALIDPAEPDRQRFVPLPGKPISIGYDSGSGTALASIHGDQVCVVDLARETVARTIATRADPDPVAVVRDHTG